jgi:uncharacterized coiled-coil protein SlyX
MSEWVTIKDAVGILGMSERTLRRHIAEGKIESRLEEGRRYVSVNGTANDMPTDMPIGIQQLLDEKDARIQQLEDQLARHAQQIDHLTQVVAMSQKNIGALTEQLDDSRQMIEDMRTCSWWKRIFRK